MLAWAAWQLQYSPTAWELSENILQNLGNKWPPHAHLVEVDAGFAPPKDGALDDGVPPKIDPDGFEGDAPKTEPEVAAAAVEEAPKMPPVGVAVAAAVAGAAADLEGAVTPPVTTDGEGVGVPKRDPVVLGAAAAAAAAVAAAAAAAAAGDEEAVAAGVGKRAGLLMADSGFWLAAVNDAFVDIVVAVVGGLGTFAGVEGIDIFGAAVAAAGDPKLKAAFVSAAPVPKLKPGVPPPPPEVFVVDARPNPGNEGGGGLGAAVDEGGAADTAGGGFVAGVVDDANAIGFGGVEEGVIVTLPRLNGLVILIGGSTA